MNAYAKLVADTAPVTLRSLVEQAIAATDAASFALRGLGEYECTRADDLAFDARKRLADYLLTEHGITTALAKRLGEVLPV